MRRKAPLGLVAAGALCSVAALSVTASAATPAAPLSGTDVARIEQLMATTPFDRGTWGLLVTDLATDEELYRLNATEQFQAASTTKNFTAAATLDGLGAGYRFRTPVVRRGDVTREGRLAGDLVLVASGDLTMGGRQKGDGTVAFTGFDHTDANEVPGAATLTPQDPLAGLNRLARQVRQAGITRVQGDVVIDDRLWRQRHVGHEVISPIVINDNMIDITMTPTAPGELVRAQTRPADGPTNVEVGEADGRTVVVSGTIAADENPLVQVFRVPEPAYFARTLFVEALRRAGVTVKARAVAPNRARQLPPRRQVAALPRVALLTSPPVSEFADLYPDPSVRADVPRRSPDQGNRRAAGQPRAGSGHRPRVCEEPA